MRIIGDRAMLFTDIEASTALLQRVGHPRYVRLLDQHHRILRATIEQHDGQEIQNEGDSFVVLFASVGDAVAAAITAQRDLRAGPWPADGSVNVRMGVHEGEVGVSESGHHGLALHEAARVAAAAHGGQILVSDAARARIESGDTRMLGVSLEELGLFALKDIGAHVPLIQVLHADLASDFPPPRTVGSTQHNLPAQLTSLVGRETETRDVSDLVQQHRLVSLLGSGGVGKTRLALRVAAVMTREFHDGVWFVELAKLQDPDVIMEEIRRSIRAPDDGRGAASVLDALARKHALLVLDNCEHLVSRVAEHVGDLIKWCPQLHVLVTSREPIGSVGEVQWRVPSLPSSEAVELFRARAELVSSGFDLGPDDLVAIRSICDRLDGIPLAIELAAARVGTIPIDEIEYRLLDQLRLLRAGGRGVVARHQTLKATLEWSYRLLNSEEQQLFSRLAVFRGSPELPAVEAVCATDPLDPIDVAELVESLHSKSLVSLDASTRPARIRISEIVRQFADAMLAESGRRAQLAERHAEYYLDFSARALVGARGAQRTTWLSRMATDRDNFGAAFEWLHERRPDDAAVLIGNTKEWLVVSHDRSWLERLRLTASRTDLSPRSVAISNGLRALLAGGYGREPAEVAVDAAERAHQNLEAIEDPRERVRTLTNTALGFRESDPELAATISDQAVAEAQALGDDSELAWALSDLIFVRHEHHPETERLRSMLLELVDRLGSRWTNVHPLVDDALAAHQVGDHDRSLQRLQVAEEMLAASSRGGGLMSEDAQVWTTWSVLIRAELGDTATAILMAEDALADSSDKESIAYRSLSGTYGQALLLAGRSTEARSAFEWAIAQEDAWRYLSFAIAALGVGVLDIEGGNPNAAYSRLQPIATDNRRVWVRARAHDGLAWAALEMADHDAAAEHVRRADELRRSNGFVLPAALIERADETRRRIARTAATLDGRSAPG